MSATLSPHALTSIEAARALVLRNPDNAAQDDVLTRLINSVSQTVRRYLMRQMFPDDDATYLFTWDGSEFLNFAPYEIRVMDSISYSLGTSTAVTLDPATAAYALEPRNKTEEGTYLWLRIAASLLGFPVGLDFATISIHGDWGMEAVPADVEEAVLIEVAWQFHNPTGSSNVNAGDLHLTSFTPQRDGVPPLQSKALALLENVRRTETGI